MSTSKGACDIPVLSRTCCHWYRLHQRTIQVELKPIKGLYMYTGRTKIHKICRRCYDMLCLQEMPTWSRGAETSAQVRLKSCSKSLETKKKFGTGLMPKS